MFIYLWIGICLGIGWKIGTAFLAAVASEIQDWRHKRKAKKLLNERYGMPKTK